MSHQLISGMLSGLLAATMAHAQVPPPLELTLGATNAGTGLFVPSAGDGHNEPVVVEGSPARRIAGDQSSYLYVAIRDPAWTNGPVDAYVGAELFDDGIRRLDLQYDRVGSGTDQADRYALAVSPTVLTGSGRWRTAWFRLPALRLGHGQNHRADFRLRGRGLAVRRLTVTTQPPPDWRSDEPIDAESLALLRVQRPAGMEVCFGNDAAPSDAALFRAIGVSSVESYVDWAGVEPEPGRWDWRKWDEQTETLRKAELKWVPFLIAGAAYATPLWFQRSTDSRVFRCLDHDRDSAVQSLFNPALRPRIASFVRELARRYGGTGILESLLLGVSGIYGESIYPAGPEGGWTARLTGDYHNHLGWWAADPLARASFRDAMRTRYGTIDRLNSAWSCAPPLRSFDEVDAFHPDRAPSDRARADFAGWYQRAMTDWSVFWVKTVRDALPEAEIYLCTGGDGTPALGADFTAQAKAIAPYRAGIRITNEGSDYDHNFTLTREVATATRLYGTFCGFEPAAGVSAAGNVARIYNASASGARQLHCYRDNVVGDDPQTLPLFRANIGHLKPRQPRINSGIYVPRETWELDPARVGGFHDTARILRDVTDLDFVTRLSVVDGGLRNLRTLVLPDAVVLEPAAAAAIEQWVRDGGTLVVATQPGEQPGSRLHDQTAWRERLLASTTGEVTRAGLLKRQCDLAPARWQLDIGGGNDAVWLTGEWHGPERRPGWAGGLTNVTVRWTGARPGLLLPTQPGVNHRLLLSVQVPPAALGDTQIVVRVNDQEVGHIDRAGLHDARFPVPAALLTSSLARLELQMRAWKPSGSGNSRDDRALGIEVRAVEWTRDGAENDAPGQALLTEIVDDTALQSLVHRTGSGRTLYLPGILRDRDALARVTATLLEHPADGRMDQRFATKTETGVVWFDQRSATITESTHP